MPTKVPPSRLDSTKDFSSLVPAAFDQANSAAFYANAAFIQANAAFAQANTGGGGGGADAVARDTANSASLYANGAFIQANTATNNAAGASLYANGAFIQANTATNDAAGASLYANGAFIQANTATNDAAGASQYANAAFAHANAAYAQANTGGGGGGEDTWARAQANAAFTKANSEIIIFAVTDDTSNITVSSARASFRAPSAMTLTALPRASLNVASTSGIVNVDIKVAGTTILGSNKLTIDATEKTSTTALTATSYSTTSVADDAEISVDILAAGTGAKGLKITLYYTD
jgi:hypothetical protein